ncbi:MAG: hypothetical protein P8X91_07260 [Candidatus Bathyarchaeota archaeon]
MKNNLYSAFIVISMLLFYLITPINAQYDPVPNVSGSIIYPDTCNPEFHVDFEISNLGAASSSASYFVVSLSSHLEFVNWNTTPEVPDLQIRFFEMGDNVLNISNQIISAKNTIIEVYNHSFTNGESIKITMFFELNLYQSSTEWIEYNLIMFPQADNSQTSLTKVADPENSDILNQQGYPTYKLRIPINNTIVETNPDELEIVPEFGSFIFPVIFLIAIFLVIIYRKQFIE